MPKLKKGGGKWEGNGGKKVEGRAKIKGGELENLRRE